MNIYFGPNDTTNIMYIHINGPTLAVQIHGNLMLGG